MTAVIRSLADSLRRFGDDRLEALLVARPDLTSPLPRGIGPLAARAAGSTSARRALEALTLPELHLVEALAVLEDGASPAQLAAAVSSAPATIAAGLERLITLALVWGEDELHLIRPLRDGLRTSAGLAAPSPRIRPSRRRASGWSGPEPPSRRFSRRSPGGPARSPGAAGSPRTCSPRGSWWPTASRWPSPDRPARPAGRQGAPHPRGPATLARRP
ncbi:hypothetical protein [Brachybacterium sp. Z12]|uniref:hypothetical protein n=1 Tax=Brachybacterium sp. Z12 TaxID=2759167 RepID=UPI00223C34A0|nr:hypothetical protein [Brachybacterium sp. Z12]